MDVTATTPKTESIDLEIKLLLEAIFFKYNYDFRDYAGASVKRRLLQALHRFELPTITALQEKLIHDPFFFNSLLQYLTIPTSEMFRDAQYYQSIREKIIPILKTYPSIKLWIAGCSTGEELYSFAILLKEEGLLDKTIIYATDINPLSLKRAEEGFFADDLIDAFQENYKKAGGHFKLRDYGTAAYGKFKMDRNLIQNTVFADHSLATDSVFSEVNFVSCRNVLIYFNSNLQERALGLFNDSLCYKGFLGLGSKETIRFSRFRSEFSDFSPLEKIYQKSGRP